METAIRTRDLTKCYGDQFALDGTVPSAFAALPLVALVFLALAVPLFASRDVGTS
jgi:hypothetical protein